MHMDTHARASTLEAVTYAHIWYSVLRDGVRELAVLTWSDTSVLQHQFYFFSFFLHFIPPSVCLKSPHLLTDRSEETSLYDEFGSCWRWIMRSWQIQRTEEKSASRLLRGDSGRRKSKTKRGDECLLSATADAVWLSLEDFGSLNDRRRTWSWIHCLYWRNSFISRQQVDKLLVWH